MLKFELIDVEAMPYLYEEHSCSMDPSDISATMESAFPSVMSFLSQQQITPRAVLSVYYSYDPDRMNFRAGFAVSPGDAAKAAGAVKAAATPAGRVLNFTHIGPYAKLRDSYGTMMAHMDKEGLKPGAPTWEVYVNDPMVTPPEELETNVFVSLAED